MKRPVAICVIITVMLVGLPLLGIALKGEALGLYTEFPPITRYVLHAGFSLPVFCLLALLFLATALGLALALAAARKNTLPAKQSSSPPFPWWGWAGLTIMLAGWVFAWNRFQWLKPTQHHTFLPLWIGYILTVNGLCIRRSGRSLLTDGPGRFLLLFPASAVFWWFFEYLNRFVQNWYYTGVEHFTPGAYILFATLSFSTVLPAVLSTTRLLLSFPVFLNGLQKLPPLRTDNPTYWARTVLLISALGLTFIGVLPDVLFPLLWVSPLLIIVSLQTLAGKKTIFSPLADGDWRTVIAPALAALACGFFWELWNVGSLARWEYAIPFVHCCKIFEMPLLGYMGYLPFGLACWVVGAAVLGGWEARMLGCEAPKAH
jgi:hypothetical protein